MVKGNTIFEGKGPRSERVPNGLQEAGGWQECPQPHIQLAETETWPQSLERQNDSSWILEF